MEKNKPDEETEKELINFVHKILRIFKNDSFMITIIILALLVCVYCAYYSKVYDIKIQTFYHDYIKENCKDLNGDLKYGRPNIFSLESFKGEVLNETKS